MSISVKPEERELHVANIAPWPQWRHKKRGGTYTEMGRARMQVDGPLDMAEVVVYQSNTDGSIWVRPVSEFMDGRFERVRADDEQPPDLTAAGSMRIHGERMPETEK